MTDEHAIIARFDATSPAPPPALRDRVLTGVRAELSRSQRDRSWGWTIGLAASLLIGMNLALIAGQQTQLPTDAPSGDHADADRIAQVVPEIDAAEARRMAVRLRLSGSVIAVPPLVRPTRLGDL